MPLSPANPASADEPRDERERLGAALRALLEVVVSTGADAEELLEAAAEVDALTARLAAAPSAPESRVRSGAFRHEMSLIGGAAHPVAPQLHLTTSDDGVTGTVTVSQVFEGAPGLVHGGVLSLLFDHALGHAAIAAGYGAMTVSLNVSYKAPTPLGVPLGISARLDRIEGRKLYLSGQITVDGKVSAQAEGLFVILTGDNVAAIFPGRS